MASIRVQDVTCQFGGQVVLRNVTLDLHDGEIVGVVGPNGAGKSTLFKIIADMIPLELGTVTRSKGLEVGYLPQEPQLDSSRSLREESSAALAEVAALEERMHALAERIAAEHGTPNEAALLADYDRVTTRFHAAGGYDAAQRLREIISGLGFLDSDLDRPVGTLSGGQKCRVALARMLVEDRQFLLLDEPTNHLDLDAVRWLERFLAGHHGGAAIISHDRYLLDRVAQKIVEVDKQSITVYTGNYTIYAETKELRRLSGERQFEKDAAFLAKERDFIARHMAGQRSKEAQGRRARLERRLAAGEFILEKPKERRGLEFNFDGEREVGGPVLRAEGLAKTYGPRRLFTDLSLQVDAGVRMGITGPNGTGKTTLLKILLGQMEPDAGEVQLQPRMALGHYAQDSGALPPEQNPLGVMLAHRAGLTEARARGLLGRFGFRGDDVFKPFAKLSGGEQSRVRLLSLILDNPNVLVLDEPTNHLDISAREALEDALQEYPGAIIVVSHDRYFLDRVVDQLMVIRPESVRLYRGNYDFYIAEVEREAAEAATAEKAKAKREGTGRKDSRQAQSTRPTSRFDRLTIEEIEARIMSQEEEIGLLTERFAEPEVYRDPAAMAELQSKINDLKSELTLLDNAWNERANST
jgi:ATP-binding cassette subfamily F protein 3